MVKTTGPSSAYIFAYLERRKSFSSSDIYMSDLLCRDRDQREQKPKGVAARVGHNMSPFSTGMLKKNPNK